LVENYEERAPNKTVAEISLNSKTIIMMRMTNRYFLIPHKLIIINTFTNRIIFYITHK